MHEEDIRRLQRERDIAEAARGPDYSHLEAEIRAAKREVQRRQAASDEALQRERAGYYLAAAYGGVQRTEYGAIPAFRP